MGRQELHRHFEHPTKPGKVTVPGSGKDELRPSTLNSILRQAGEIAEGFEDDPPRPSIGRQAPADNPEAVDVERLERLAELRAEFGGDLDERFGPGSFGLHELLHTAHVVTKLASDELLDHPACVRDADLHAAAARAVDALADLYQRAGAKA